jgi:hypothetical protein
MADDLPAPIIEEVLETRVYLNEAGGITISQIDPYERNTYMVAFPVMYARRIINAIQAALDECDGD